MSMVEQRTVSGTVVDILARIGSDGGEIVEIRMKTAGGDHRAMAHGDKAVSANKLREKMEVLMRNNGRSSIGELGVPLEVVGIAKDPTTTVVTAMKIAN